MLRRCGVVGHPVEHSLSPAIHRAAYVELGLDWEYIRVDLAPGTLGDFVAGLDERWRGLSVTMPHKEDAARVGAGDETVRLTGVANTLVFDQGAVLAHNTDVAGFQVALAAHGVDRIGRAIIVGNGATARSAVAALAGLGTTAVQFVVRSLERGAGAVRLAESLGIDARLRLTDEPLAEADLLISTVPAQGVFGHQERLAEAAPVIFDGVYDPWPTPLAQAAGPRGRMLLNGLDLLAGQAVDQVRWFTGSPISFETARRAAVSGLQCS